MYRIDDATAATSLPAPEAASTEGYFTEGNPATGTPATKVRGSWMNMIQEELCSILAAAGIARSKTTYNQVNSALQKMYSPVVGSVRNLAMNIPAASATATLTADQIIVGSALGGQTFALSNFNKTINLGGTGAGGMDAGSASPNGTVAIYAIYNPTTGASALLATNASATVAPSIYGGGNMPAGYTASALVSALLTNASGQMFPVVQVDREIHTVTSLFAQTNSQISSLTQGTIGLPPNAKTFSGWGSINSTNAVNAQVNIAGTSTNIGGQQVAGSAASSGETAGGRFSNVPLVTPQKYYWSALLSSGTFNQATLYNTSYTI
ncbi:hypothetical protein WS87_12695 [Burkholderia sp. MSMB0856]|uniref:hypothetical protein n=1 Tax=Burkholderia sp. MSMB0856 TaxID=1637869 RepID=UPI00075B160A|nr:hypothetical protein [Burkholderia sp. MSMB0856]AOJ86140.1 hypothetical protein WS87_05390 [Burkholderia sp. MSMB0856]AOJ87472.1 hypothetical protein WS87_12695 [Burkholderia sp. MSMB0856]KVH33243.1 hypothetical protein WS87_22080 [Burkholderia sp. MSMB0856]